MPKWYGLTIILIYSVMIAEFVKVLNTLFMVGGIEKVALMEKIVQLRHYKIFCVNGNTGFRNESRIFYFIHLQNEEAYERKESSSA